MAAAGLWTTPTDLAKYAIGVQQAVAGKSRLLSADMARQMLNDFKNGQGLGPGVSGSGRRFNHRGRDRGFDALLIAYAQPGDGLVVMINGNDNTRLMQGNRIIDFVAKRYKWPEWVDNDQRALRVSKQQHGGARSISHHLQDLSIFRRRQFVELQHTFEAPGSSRKTSRAAVAAAFFRTVAQQPVSEDSRFKPGDGVQPAVAYRVLCAWEVENASGAGDQNNFMSRRGDDLSTQRAGPAGQPAEAKYSRAVSAQLIEDKEGLFSRHGFAQKVLAMHIPRLGQGGVAAPIKKMLRSLLSGCRRGGCSSHR